MRRAGRGAKARFAEIAQPVQMQSAENRVSAVLRMLANARVCREAKVRDCLGHRLSAAAADKPTPPARLGRPCLPPSPLAASRPGPAKREALHIPDKNSALF